MAAVVEWILPLLPRQHRAYVLGYVLMVALLAGPFWLVQPRLFAAAGGDPSALFSYRLSDSPIFAALPTVMVGMVAAPPILYRVVRDRLDWPGIA